MQQLSSLLRKWLSNETVKQVWVLFSGTTVSQAIPILVTLILARIYPEEAFGVFFIFSSATMLLSIISTLKMELSVMLPESEKEAAQLWGISVFAAIFVSLILLILAFILRPHLNHFRNFENLRNWIFLLPVSVLFGGIFQSSSFWFNRNKRYNRISAGRIVRSGFVGLFQVLLGVLRFFNQGLILGFVSGYTFGGFYNTLGVIRKHKISYFLSSRRQVKNLLKKYLNIPIYNTSMGILNTLSNQLPIYVLAGFYSLEQTAYYGLAHRFIGLPVYLIGQSVGQVFFRKASELNNEGGNMRALLMKTAKRLFLFALVPFILLFLFAPGVFSLMLGEQWREAGNFARYISPWLFLSFTIAPVSYIVTILNRQKPILFYEVFVLAIRYLAIYLGFRLYGEVKYSILFFTVVNVFFYFILFGYYLYITKQKND